MIQITEKKAEDAAIKAYGLGSFMMTALQKWIAENRHRVALGIDSGSKTCLGEYPGGWKKAMMVEAEAAARAAVKEHYIRKCGMRIDGAIWIDPARIP